MQPAGGCAAAPPGRSGRGNNPDSADPLPLRSHCCCTAGPANGGGMGGARVDGGAPRQADKESERWGREVIHHVQIGHLLCKTDSMEEKQEVGKCCGICSCPYLVVLIVALYASVPVVAQTSLCKEHIADEAPQRRGALQVHQFPKQNRVYLHSLLKLSVSALHKWTLQNSSQPRDHHGSCQ